MPTDPAQPMAAPDSSPLTGAARDLESTLDLTVVESSTWDAGCRMRIAYPRAPDTETAHAEMAVMIERLLADGWSGDPEFRSHGATLTKDGVHVIRRPQNPSLSTRNIELIVHRPDH